MNRLFNIFAVFLIVSVTYQSMKMINLLGVTIAHAEKLKGKK